MPTALFSVYDKEKNLPFARALAQMNWRILASDGTARAFTAAGLAVISISALTGSPEVLDGRVKSFHPAIYAGILARAKPEHFSDLARVQAILIDLVMVDLPSFPHPNLRYDDMVENINVGGAELLRAAAKNYQRVTAVVDPEDQAGVLAELHAQGQTELSTRKALAVKAFRRISAYDAQVADTLESSEG